MPYLPTHVREHALLNLLHFSPASVLPHRRIKGVRCLKLINCTWFTYIRYVPAYRMLYKWNLGRISRPSRVYGLRGAVFGRMVNFKSYQNLPVPADEWRVTSVALFRLNACALGRVHATTTTTQRPGWRIAGDGRQSGPSEDYPTDVENDEVIELKFGKKFFTTFAERIKILRPCIVSMIQ